MNLDKLKQLASKATPGPWLLATSNSWRRFVSRETGMSLCEPVTYCEKDRHPDLYFRNGGADGPDAAYIAAASPDVVLALIEVAEKAKAYLDSEGSGCGAEVEHEAALRSALSRLNEGQE